MKAYEIKNVSGTGRLALVDRPKPAPGPGEVLIRVRATSLNYRDILTVRSAYRPVGQAGADPALRRRRRGGGNWRGRQPGAGR